MSFSEPASPQGDAAAAAGRCPLCGKDNDCRVVRSGGFDGRCWCEDVSFDRMILNRLPEALRGRACICSRCAGFADPADLAAAAGR